MPYKRTSELPDSVREALPAAAQRIYMAAFNSFAEENPDAEESSFHSVAWAAVKRKYRKDGDEWVEKTEDSFEVHDTVTLDGVNRTKDGYLTAVANVARPGIQLYRGHEVGRPELDVVRVYRPPEEVFAPDAMRSLAHRPVTLDHPPEEVNAGNWRDYAVGQTGDEVDGRDGRYIRVPLVLMDAAAIKRVEDGHRQLSVGYHTKLLFKDGVTPDGDPYDAVQTAIRANHLAVVRAARGGPQLKIGDDAGQEKEPKAMSNKTITVDGVSIEVPDTAAQVIQRAADKAAHDLKTRDEQIADLQSKVTKAEVDAAGAATEHKAAVDAKDAEIATLKQQLADATMTPDRLDQMVKDREAVIERAKALYPTVQVDGQTEATIRRSVVEARLGDTAKGWSDEQVAVSFDTLAAASDQKTFDHKPLGQALSRPGTTVADADKAYDEYVSRITGAWDKSNQASH